MKKNLKWFSVFLTAALILNIFTACGNKTEQESEPPQVPPEVQAVKEKVTTLATDYAAGLNGEFADQHAALVASGEGRENADYAGMLAKLKAIQDESGAYYVYTLIDADPKDEGFNIIVDASPEPDDYMFIYELEGQFTDALKGTPAPALSAWDNDVDDPCWSAFAPIYDTSGNIVAILGIDYPVPEIIDFPEWNRDSKKWNGLQY